MSHASHEPLIWRVDPDGSPRVPAQSAAQNQMKLAADFAAIAAWRDDLPALQQEICRVAALGLGTAFAKLLVYDPVARDFLLEAGVGWDDGIVAATRLAADLRTAAGLAWHNGEPIISNNLATEVRFRVPAISDTHAIVRSVHVVVPTKSEPAFGVLEVDSDEQGRFAEHDVSFLENLAQSLAAAIDRGALSTAWGERLRRSSHHHRTAMQELQHRVRNDLQVLYSVVSLEGRGAPDPVEATGFGRIARRVLNLAGLYDQLLTQDGNGEIDLGGYLLSLCDKIASSRDLSADGIVLKVVSDCLMLPAERAVSLGAAVNELVTNAIKHAFPERKGGRITVKLIATCDGGAGHPVVEVADNGCGFGGPRPGGLGLTLAEELTRQAGGVLLREHREGCAWRIELSR